jgi:hypothetical protein
MSTKQESQADPLALLLSLEFARQRADATTIKAAKEKLAKIGIRVIYGPPQNPARNRRGNRGVSHVALF